MTNMDRHMKKIYDKNIILNKRIILTTICSILILSSASIVVAEDIHVSSSRYSIFSPWMNKASDTSLSANFTAYALLLNDTGAPVLGQGITFKIYNGSGGLKVSKTNITQKNGLASVSYDTINDFASRTDTDYGTWRIEAYLTSNASVKDNTTMKIEVGGDAIDSTCKEYCHDTGIATGNSPKSPYTDSYGSTTSRVVAAHEKARHQNYGCFLCHPGYAANKTVGQLGKTGDVHKNRTCDFCHGNWSYIGGTGSMNGNGIPKMPSCSQCHTIFNNNVKNISTIANLLGGNNNISVYSYNYDTKTPLAAHNGTTYSLAKSVPCIVCHGPVHNNSKPYNIGSTNGVTENEQCWSCHTNRATTHKLNTNCVSCHTQDAHNISIPTGGGGGPDCLSCHNTGGSAAHKVDGIAMNSTSAVHKNLNSGASATVNAENKKCWGCHQTGGTQPTDMGDRYLNPYKCYDCHNVTKPYSNVAGALTVSEHFKSGMDIQAAISATDNSTSCILCHNISDMKVSYTEADLFNSQFSLASHYDKNRSDLRIAGNTDCKYCHQNTSTIFSLAMNNTANNNLSNHSTLASTPICTDCHSTGKLHDSSLSKPTNSDDNYCKTCHSTKNEHKALYCTECHANNTNGSKAGRDIHGIKYLQKDNTFVGNKTNAVDCKTCHQSNVVDSSLGTFVPEKIGELHHSNNITNGTRWGNYWISSGDACIYCHNDTRHSSTPLGRPLAWNPSYMLRTTIGSGSNCADCHYKGDSNYTLMSSTLTGAGLEKPPEITNGSWNGKSGYYNHTLSDYTDQQCKGCHYGGSGTTVGQMLHNISEGGAVAGGGPDCKSCHNIGGIAPKLINFSVANSSSSAHKNLNSGASSTVNTENKKCWACHGDGAQPSNHPSNYKTPLDCTTCHTTGTYTAPKVAEHNQIGQDIVTAVNCTQCHDNSGMFLNFDIGTLDHYIKYITNISTTPYQHLGPINTASCIDCHNGPYTNNPDWGSPVNISTSTKRIHNETTTAQCDLCHNDATVSTLANVDFHNAAIKLGAGQGPNCLDCHTGAG